MNPAAKRPRYDAPEPAMRVAGAWLARRDRGFSGTEAAEFERWRAANASHAAAVAQLEETLHTFDRLRTLVASTAADRPPDPDFFAPRSGRRRRWIAQVGGFATLAAAAAFAVLLFRDGSASGESRQRFHTSVHATERAVLADGSVATLNRDSQLLVEFTRTERRLHLLRGEAHFDVVRDPARPFIVAAGPVLARAIGTAFTIRLDDTQIEVLVTSGRVQVGGTSQPPVNPAAPATLAHDAMMLGPGFRAIVHRESPAAVSAPRVVQLTTEEIDRRMAWQPRLLDLTNATLAGIVAEFNRRAAGSAVPRLVLDDPALAELRIGGSIYPEQPDAFVRLLEKSFGIRAERRDDTIVLHRTP